MYRLCAVVATVTIVALQLLAAASSSPVAALRPIDILRSFYDATNGPYWKRNYGWSNPASTDPCPWYGVRCEEGNVVTILLSNNSLSGALPSVIFELTLLRTLDLANNKLSGALPATIGNLGSLTTLYLDNNEFSGALPETIGNLTALEWVFLSKNKFSGALPATIGNLAKLRILFLQRNSLSGALPATMGELTELQWLDIANNQFEGFVPAGLCNVPFCDARGNRLCSQGGDCNCPGVPKCSSIG